MDRVILMKSLIMRRVGRLPVLLAGIILELSIYSLPIKAGITDPENGQPAHSFPETISQTEEHTDAEQEKFNPGEFIFDHIGDAHDWHIITVGHKDISIPLPILLYSRERGFVVFMSTRFEHGHASYKGFHIENEGDNKGKIVESLADGSEVFPLDISITKNVAALLCSVIIILLIFISIANAYKRNPLSPPRGLQSILEPVILFIRDEVAKPSIGEKKYESFMPYLLTVFFFIWINNMLGLVPFFPGGANVTGNIAVTGVLALITFTITTVRGNKNYWKHIVNTPGVPVWLKVPPLPIMPIIETLGIFIKPFVLMVRLFANITAGHIIGLGFSVSVISVFFIMFMTLLELLVAFIQAYVFTFLSALYFGMAVEEHH